MKPGKGRQHLLVAWTWAVVATVAAAVALIEGWVQNVHAASAEAPRVEQRARRPVGPAGVTLEPVLAPAPGVQGSFVITETDEQGLLSRTGIFLLASDEELQAAEAHAVRSVRADYRVLEPDAQTGRPRLRVTAWPVDPRTGQIVGSARWEAVYRLAPGDVEQEAGSVVPEAYRSLVEPRWLTGWTYTPAEELPRGAIEPGDGWQSTPHFELEGFPFGPMEPVQPLQGRFMGWEQLEGAPAAAAHISEEVAAASHVRQDLWEGAPGEVSFEMAISSDYWLVPGGFPLKAERRMSGEVLMTLGPGTGAPAYLEGSTRFFFMFHRVVRWMPPGL